MPNKPCSKPCSFNLDKNRFSVEPDVGPGFNVSVQYAIDVWRAGWVNTDVCPVVTFRAPMLAYSKVEPPSQRLASIVQSLSSHRENILAADPAQRMQKYWRARDQYLLAAVVMEQVTAEEWDSALESLLLDVVRVSGDFEPAYFTLLMMAQERYSHSPRESLVLLNNLHAASPDHAEASQLRRRLFGDIFP